MKKKVWLEILGVECRREKKNVIVGRSLLAKAGSFLLIKTNSVWEGSTGAEGRGKK